MRWIAGWVTTMAAMMTMTLLVPSGLPGQSRSPDVAQGLQVVRVDTSVEIDGVLTEDIWREAPPVRLAWEIDPADNGPAPVRTECRIARSGGALLLGCEALDERPDAIRAYVTDRDALDGQDRIQLTLDPFADARRGFRFTVSALGVQGDALVSASLTPQNGQGPSEEDPSWDAIWASAGSITDEGYVVEAAIPFRSLRFPAGASGGPWRFHIERIWPRDRLTRLRTTPLDRSDGCSLCQTAPLRGLRGVEPGMNVQLTPTFTASRTGRPSDGAAPGSPLDDHATTGDFGLTGRWGVTPGLALGLTANPDFSQVEADVAQLDVNNQFSLFFPERRPFFLEGSDVFSTPLQAVFTRTIADPSAGAKLSGKVGALALGFLGARDEAPPLLIPGSQSSRTVSLDGPVTTAVGRVRRDLGRASTVGALYAGREGDGYHNRMGGIDALLRPVSSLTLRVQGLVSTTDYPDSLATAADQPTSAFSGTALRLSADWSTRDWGLRANFTQTDHDFRADAGFVPQVGTRGGNIAGRRTFRGGRDRWYDQILVDVGYWRNREIGGPVLSGNGMWIGLVYQGPRQSRIGLWPNLFWSQHFGGESWTGMNNLYMEGSIRPWADLSLRFDANVGDAVDFANVRRASEAVLSPSVELRAGRHVTLSLAHRFRRLSVDGDEIFTAQLSEARGWYNFSPRSFLRVIVQNRWTDRNPGLFDAPVDPRDRSLVVQALYSYKLNPETVFFVGYGDDREGADGLHPTARTFFLKLGYAWRP